MAKSMANASKAMQAMGAAADPQAMQQSMAAFSRENQKMDMASGARPPLPQCSLPGTARPKPTFSSVKHHSWREFQLCVGLGMAPKLDMAHNADTPVVRCRHDGRCRRRGV